MVMLTRSRKRACESCSSSEGSHKNVVPPWCSSAKLQYEKKRRLSWEAKSSCDLRENIWEYLHRNEKALSIKRTGKRRKHSRRCMKVTKMLTFALFSVVVVASIWISKDTRHDLMTKVLPYTKLIPLPIGQQATPVTEECCYRMKYLAAALSRMEQILRNTQRMKRTMLLASNQYVEKNADDNFKLSLLADAVVTKGRATEEWGGKVALWGIVPLWRAAPPPDTVLSLRRPVPADCWPFSGSIGGLNIELPQKEFLHCISLEHVRPDTARSSPKNFALFGIMENGTWLKTLEAEYKYQGPAKQFFTLTERKVPLKKLVFQIYSNNGNDKYTCLYRIHLYKSNVDKKMF